MHKRLQALGWVSEPKSAPSNFAVTPVMPKVEVARTSTAMMPEVPETPALRVMLELATVTVRRTSEVLPLAGWMRARI